MSIAIAIVLHIIAINIWVGGTFFTVVVLNPPMTQLDASRQLPLADRVFRRFFTLIWLVMPVLIGTGGWMIYAIYGGLAATPVHVKIMALLGISMSVTFLLIFFGPYRRYQQSRQHADQQATSLSMMTYIRQLNILNMLLGICVVIVIGAGPYFVR
jgi:uncharacterized membrane protein